jgi:hypothetical protein
VAQASVQDVTFTDRTRLVLGKFLPRPMVLSSIGGPVIQVQDGRLVIVAVQSQDAKRFFRRIDCPGLEKHGLNFLDEQAVLAFSLAPPVAFAASGR